MGRIYYIMGKSATGKDTIYKELLRLQPQLKKVVPYTTRPIREGETDGVEYFFVTRSELASIRESGNLIELRTYDTVMGPWDYFTVEFELSGDTSCLMIGTLSSYEEMCSYFGRDRLSPVYIEVPDRLRLLRAIEREELQRNPNYQELCRRYLADEEDFTEETLTRLGIETRFQNISLDRCLTEIQQKLFWRNRHGRRKN